MFFTVGTLSVLALVWPSPLLAPEAFSWCLTSTPVRVRVVRIARATRNTSTSLHWVWEIAWFYAFFISTLKSPPWKSRNMIKHCYFGKSGLHSWKRQDQAYRCDCVRISHLKTLFSGKLIFRAQQMRRVVLPIALEGTMGRSRAAWDRKRIGSPDKIMARVFSERRSAKKELLIT